MIKLKTSLAGTDKHGKKFSVSYGGTVELDDKSEKNLVLKGLAELVKPVRKSVKK